MDPVRRAAPPRSSAGPPCARPRTPRAERRCIRVARTPAAKTCARESPCVGAGVRHGACADRSRRASPSRGGRRQRAFFREKITEENDARGIRRHRDLVVLRGDCAAANVHPEATDQVERAARICSPCVCVKRSRLSPPPVRTRPGAQSRWHRVRGPSMWESAPRCPVTRSGPLSRVGRVSRA
jgi:hypothetical protein